MQIVRAYSTSSSRLLLGQFQKELHVNSQCWQALVTGTSITKSPTGNVAKRRRIAYFRVLENQRLVSVHFTAHGREAGVRTWRAYRDEDPVAVPVDGAEPVRTDPHVERHEKMMHLCVGEGRAEDISGWGRARDRWGIPVRSLAVAVLRSDGWLIQSVDGSSDHWRMKRAQIERGLRLLGENYSSSKRGGNNNHDQD